MCALLVLPASVVAIILAPEIVLVLLGPAWVKVVVPFRILAFGMLFRTSYKLSDSVSRATGAVYARAWRQAIYACAILLGAVVGQFWGVEGVAVGVLFAISLNFLLMAQLSLRLTDTRWTEFAAAQLPGIALASVLGLPAWLVLAWLRDLDFPPLVRLVETAAFAFAGGVLACWIMPSIFLGHEAAVLARSVIAIWVSRTRARPVAGA